MAAGVQAVTPGLTDYDDLPVLWLAGRCHGLHQGWGTAARGDRLAAAVACTEVGWQDPVTNFVQALRAYVFPPPALAVEADGVDCGGAEDLAALDGVAGVGLPGHTPGAGSEQGLREADGTRGCAWVVFHLPLWESGLLYRPDVIGHGPYPAEHPCRMEARFFDGDCILQSPGDTAAPVWLFVLFCGAALLLVASPLGRARAAVISYQLWDSRPSLLTACIACASVVRADSTPRLRGQRLSPDKVIHNQSPRRALQT